MPQEPVLVQVQVQERVLAQQQARVQVLARVQVQQLVRAQQVRVQAHPQNLQLQQSLCQQQRCHLLVLEFLTRCQQLVKALQRFHPLQLLTLPFRYRQDYFLLLH
jgi:hypothetical protein